MSWEPTVPCLCVSSWLKESFTFRFKSAVKSFFFFFSSLLILPPVSTISIKQLDLNVNVCLQLHVCDRDITMVTMAARWWIAFSEKLQSRVRQIGLFVVCRGRRWPLVRHLEGIYCGVQTDSAIRIRLSSVIAKHDGNQFACSPPDTIPEWDEREALLLQFI